MLRTTKYKVPYRCKYCKAIFPNKNDHLKHVQKHGISPNIKKKSVAEAKKVNEQSKIKLITPISSSFNQEERNTAIKAIGEYENSQTMMTSTRNLYLNSVAGIELNNDFSENAPSVSTRHRPNSYNEPEELVSHYTCNDCDRYFYQRRHLAMHKKKCSKGSRKITSKTLKLEEKEYDSFEIDAKEKGFKIKDEYVTDATNDTLQKGEFHNTSHSNSKPWSSANAYSEFRNEKKVSTKINFDNIKRKPVSLLQQLLTRNAKASPDYNFPIRTIATPQENEDDNNYSCTTVKQVIRKKGESNDKIVDKIVFRRVKPACYICQKKYAKTSLVNEHILKKHFGKSDETVACGCDVCKVTFKNFLAFQMHVCFAPYRCAFCDRTFKEMMEFQNHIHNHMRHKVR